MKLLISMLMTLILVLQAVPAASQGDQEEVLMVRTYRTVIQGDLTVRAVTWGLVLHRGLNFDQVEGSLKLPDSASDLVLQGNLAYVANGPRGVVVADLTDPKAPTLVKTLATRGAAMRVVIDRGMLYAGLGTMGISVWDLGDPRDPKPLKDLEVPTCVRDLIPTDQGLVVTGEETWLLTPEGKLTNLGRPATNGFKVGDLIALSQGRDLGLYQLEQGSLKPQATLNLDDQCRGTALNQTHLFTANGNKARIFDLRTNPPAPLLDLELAASTNSLLLQGNNLIISTDRGPELWDIKDPAKPGRIYPVD